MKKKDPRKLRMLSGLILFLCFSSTLAIGQSINTYPYFENFDGATTAWTSGGSSTWALGAPGASLINSPYSAPNVWATNLTGNYPSNDSAFIESPVFDFTSLSEPVIEFKMWYDIQTGYSDGVTCMYSLDAGLTWDYLGIGIGALSGDPSGDNWFNTMSIEGLSFYNGWAGTSAGWETMKYRPFGTGALVDLSNETSVKFRFLFGSNSSTVKNGVAIDDFAAYQNPVNDLRVLSISTDPTCIGSTALNSVYIEVQNEGSATQTAFDISYSIDGGASYVTESVTASLAFGDIETYTFTTQADLTAPGTYTIEGQVILAIDQNQYNNVITIQQTVIGGILTENFESWLPMQTTVSCTTGTLGAEANGWTQDQNDGGEWRADAGGTVSSSTGPSVDFDPGTSSGTYMYLESGSPCYGITCNLISPCFDFSADAYKMSFAYHMYGAAMGSLSVDVWDGTQWVLDVWTISGDLGNTWYEETVALGNFQNTDARVRFRGVTGTSYTSDMAIDAIEFIQLLPDDASVLEIVPSSFCSGANDMYAVVANVGNNVLNSVTLNWEINGAAQSPVTYTTPIPLAGVDTVLLGSYSFVDGTAYDLASWSSNPNGTTDSNTSNDTASYSGIEPSMAGTYTIGATGDYPTFAAAIADIEANGLCGPIVFNVETGTYAEQVTIGEVSGVSATNTITFQAASGVNTDVVVEYAASGSSDNWVWAFDGADYVTVQNMTIKSTTTTTYGRVIIYQNSSNHTIVNNNIVESIVTTSSDAACFRSYNDSKDEFNIISNNQIKYGYYGIYYYTNSSNMEDGIQILNNEVTGYYYYGIYNYYLLNNVVSGNYVYQDPTGYSTNYGINLQYCDEEIQVNKNIVYDDAGSVNYGIRIYYCDASTTNPGLISNNFVSSDNMTSTNYGLYLYYSNHQNVYHNSVNINSGSPGRGAYVYGSSTSGIYTLANNTFAVNTGDYVLYGSTNSMSNLTSSNNNLYTDGPELCYFGSDYDQTAWQVAFPGDVLFVDPAYSSNTDLHTFSPSLNNAGMPLAMVTEDIDGEARNASTPDIGADEFTPANHDAGITEIIGVSSVCAGSADISVTVKNYGLMPITSVNVNWEVNGTVQTMLAASSLNILSGADTTLSLGSYVFVDGTSYDITAWTTLPNGNVDPNTLNNTNSVLGMMTAANGTYTIGSTGDFATINDAVDFLMSFGICGPTVFELEAGTYTEQINLGQVNGSSAVNTLTFQSASGLNTDVVIQYAASGSSDNWVWRMNGADYTTIQNLTIKSTTGSTYGRVIEFLNGADHNTIHNNILESVITTSSNAAIIRSYTDGSDNYNTISNNIMTNAYYAIYWYASSSVSETGNQFLNNTIDNYHYYGIYPYYQHAVKVIGNNIHQDPGGNGTNYAIYCQYSDGPIEVAKNTIHDDAGSTFYGIRIYYCDADVAAPGVIANNFISCEGTTGAAYGIHCQYNSNQSFYHNSVNITSGSTSTGYGAYIYASASNGSGYVFKNNNIANTGGGYAAYITENVFLNMALTSSDNNWYATGTNLAKIQTVNIPALSDWQNYYPLDVLSVPSGFASVTDLHSNSPDLNNAGTPLTEVTDDIDGDLRDALTPDIGADEYTPVQEDAGIAEIIGLNAICPGLTDVSVNVKNYGLGDIFSINLNWTVNGVLQTPLVITDTLLIGADMDVVIGTYDFLANTNYDLAAWTTNPNGAADGNTSNDTAYVNGLQTAISGTYTIGAAGDFATINAATDFMNAYGICGAVVFDIQPGVYEEQVLIDEITGSSSTNTITFQSSTGNSNDVIIQYAAAGSSDNWVWGFNGTDYTTLQNVTIKSSTTTTYGRVITFKGGSNYNSVLNNQIIGNSSNSSNSANIYSYSDAKDEYNLIKGNELSNGYYAIYWYSSSSNMEQGNIVEDNNITDFYYYGIYFYYGYAPTINGNYVEQSSTYSNSTAYPIYTRYCDGPMVITNNQTYDNTGSTFYGLYVYYCDATLTDPALIANNMISSENNTGTQYGMYLYYSNYMNVYHNSVYILAGGTTYGSYIYGSTSSGKYNFRNNSIVNIDNGYALYGTSSVINGLVSDHNNLFSNGPLLCDFTTDYPTLASWQAMYPGDVVSTNGNYLGVTDLHSLSPLLDGTGLPLSEVTTDIDGETRSAITPDIGCDEFELLPNDVKTEIVYTYGQLPLEGGTNHIVSARIRNMGLNDQINLSMTLDITGANSYTNTVVIPLLASGATEVVYFDGFTPTTLGWNTVTVSAPSDMNNSNNTATFAQEVTQATYAYADSSASVGNAGNGNDEQIWLMKYHIEGSKQVNSIQAFITNDNTVGQTVYAFVTDSQFNVLAISDPYVIQANDPNSYINISFANPSTTVTGNADFYAGFAQVSTGLGAYNPLGYQEEAPMREGAYYGSPDLTGAALTEFTDGRRFMIKAIVEDPAPFDGTAASISSPISDCGLGLETITLDITNTGSDNITAFDAVYQVGNSTPVTESAVATIIPGDSYSYAFNTAFDFTAATADSLFNITAWVIVAGDTLHYNDTTYAEVNSMYVPPTPTGIDANITYGDMATLGTVSNDSIVWFDDPNATSPFASGSSLTIGPLFDTTTVWALATVPTSVLGISEIGRGTTDYIEITNFGSGEIDATGWSVIVSDDYNNINDVNTLTWDLGIIPGETAIYRTDNSSDNYWGNNLYWNSNSGGWAAIIDDAGMIVDCIFWGGWSQADIATWTQSVNGNTIVAGDAWIGDAISSSANVTYRTIFDSNTSTDWALQATGDYGVLNNPMDIIVATQGCSSELIAVTAYVANIPDYNIGVSASISPVSGAELTSVSVCVEIENTGALAASNFPISYEVTGPINTLLTEIYVGTPIQPGTVGSYCFTVPANLSTFGVYDICAYTQLGGDTWTANDSLCWQVENVPLTYCTSTATSTGYEEIVEVSIGSFTNNSGPAFGVMYSDFTALPIPALTPGLATPITIITDFAPGYSTSYNCYTEVYVDWNHDGVWDETTDELVFSAANSSSSTISGSINTPVTALPGTHGLRIVYRESGTAANVTPCGTYSWGETEDYMIVVQEPSDHDAGATAFIAPVQTPILTENDISPVEVVVYNLGLLPITTMDVVFTIDGSIIQTVNYTGNLPSLQSDTVIFSDINVPGGYFDICAYTLLAGDTNQMNDMVCEQLYAMPQYNVEMTSIEAPLTGCNLGLEDVTITITNLGDSILDGLDVSFINNTMTAAVTETIADTIPEGAVYVYTFTTPIDLTTSVEMDFEITAYCAYGLDPIQMNDTSMVTITAGVSPIAPTADDVTIWSSEMATLLINNVDTNLNYYWYGPDTTQLVNDTVLVTPQLFDTTTYYLTAAAGSAGSIGISELCLGGTDYAEITNFTSGQIDATGWVVAASNSYTNINSVNSNLWQLGILQGGEIQYKSDSSSDNYWGSNLMWGSGSSSTFRAWLVILDNNGNIIDLWVQGWTAAELATFNTTINGFQVDFTSAWVGNGLDATSDYVERAIYDTDEALDWDVLSSGTKGNAYSNLTIQGASGSGCETELVPVTVYTQYADYDAGMVNVVSPLSWCFLTNESVSVDIYNNGLNELTNFTVYYTLDGGTPVTETVTDTIQPGATLNYTFASMVNLTAYTTYSFCAGVTVVADGYAPNNEICWIVENTNGCGLNCSDAYPYGIPGDPAVSSATTFAYDSEWWEFEVPVPYENVVVSLCGSSFDTQLQIWDSCGSTSSIYSNNDFCGTQSQITIPGILNAGTYYVRVYGNSSAFGAFELEITGSQVPKFIIDLTGTDILCNGAATGSVSANIQPGNGGTVAEYPVSYDWGAYPQTGTINNLTAGTYTVTVTDAAGWVETAEITLTEPDAIIITGVITDATTFGGNDGTIDLTVAGGVEPYNYAWSNGATTADVSSIYASMHTITVTDDNACNIEAAFSVVSPIPDSTWIPATTPANHNIIVPFNAFVTLDGSAIEPGSLIGVFYNNSGTMVCGGYAFWSGMNTTVVAYGTEPNANNGFAPGETFVWKVFDTDETEAYGGIPTYDTLLYPHNSDFAISGLSGIQSIVFQSIITQAIDLPGGWSIWSTYVEPTNPSIVSVMADIVEPPFVQGDLEIVKNGAGQIFWPYYNHLNTIGDIAIGEGYQVKINGTQQVTFGVTGLQIAPEITPFTIPNGWSIMGYLRTSPADIAVMLDPITAPAYTVGCLEIAKNGSGQIFWPFYNGLNTIGDMIPGEGYQIKNNCSATQFLYPANTTGTKSAISEATAPINYQSVKPTGDNMTIGIPADAWSVEPEPGDEIGIFDASGALIGSSVYNGSFTALTVWGKQIIEDQDKGSNGQFFNIKLWHQLTGVEEELIVEEWFQGSDEYISNSISIVGKVILADAEKSFNLGQNMPNPYNGITRIPFYLAEDCHVNLTVYNAIGELVKEVIVENRNAGAHIVEFDASGLEAGNYYYKLITDKFTSTKPMSIR